MERGFRNRPQGMLFFLFLFISLIFAKETQELIRTHISSMEELDLFLAIVAMGVTILSSEAVGFIFSSMVYFVFNWHGGYSRWFREDLFYGNFKEEIIREFENIERGNNTINADKFDNAIRRITDEALFVYFFWYHDQENENRLDTWHARRYTAYFTSWSSIIAIGAALILAVVIINLLHSCIVWGFWLWLLVSILIEIALIRNAKEAKTVVLNALDLWIAGITNERFQNVVKVIYKHEQRRKV